MPGDPTQHIDNGESALATIGCQSLLIALSAATLPAWSRVTVAMLRATAPTANERTPHDLRQRSAGADLARRRRPRRTTRGRPDGPDDPAREVGADVRPVAAGGRGGRADRPAPQ